MASDDATLTTTAPWTRFDRWAGALLMVFGIIAAVVATLVTAKTREPLFVAAIVAAGVIGAGLPLAGVYGLSAGRTWARPVAVTLLWWAILTGLVEVLAALTRSSLSIPLGAIAAVFVLRMRPAERPPWLASHGRPVALALALVLLSYGLPSAAEYVMRPGNTALSVAPEALTITAGLDCDLAAGGSAEVRMSVAWKWKQAELLPHGTDALVFRWQTADPAADDSTPLSTFQLKDARGTGFAITDQGPVRPGREGAAGPFWLGPQGPDVIDIVIEGLMLTLGASDDLARGAARQHHGGLAETVMIDVDRQQLRDDTFLMVLGFDGIARRHGILTVDVAYIHGGRWFVWSEPVSCSL